MKRRFLTPFILVFILSLQGCFLIKASPPDGTPKMVDVKGVEHSLGEHLGSHTLVFLWASWCHECLLELDMLNSIQKNLAPKGVNVVAIAVSDDLASVRETPQVRRAEYPILVDVKDQMRDRYPVHALPCVYLLDKIGNPVPLIDPEDGAKKSSVNGFREWQSEAGTRAVIGSIPH